jgi:tellurium resistance protein TerD
MTVSLSKGGNVSLSKSSPGLKQITVGLGWDERATDGSEFDLDASAFVLNSSGRVRSDDDFIFYNNLKSNDGFIEHLGDNTTGGGDGDDEQITIDLQQLDSSVDKISIYVTIHDAEARGQNFGMVSNAFIRIINTTTGEEIARYDLSEDSSTETAMIFADIYRRNIDWKFRAVGQGFAGGLGPIAKRYGVNI